MSEGSRAMATVKRPFSSAFVGGSSFEVINASFGYVNFQVVLRLYLREAFMRRFALICSSHRVIIQNAKPKGTSLLFCPASRSFAFACQNSIWNEEEELDEDEDEAAAVEKSLRHKEVALPLLLFLSLPLSTPSRVDRFQ